MKWDEHDPLYDDMNLSENEEIKTSIKKVKRGKRRQKMKRENLKKRIQEEMKLTNEDKIIFEILRENPQLKKYEKLGRIAFRKLVIEKCSKKCDLYYEKCPHLLNPEFTKNWEFKCFIKKRKNENY